MNRGDMEGLLSHYHPNCGDGERDGRIDSIVVIAVAERSGDPLLLLYCTKKRLAIIVDPEWPSMESHAQKRGVDISAHPSLPPSLPLYENKRINGWMDGWTDGRQGKGFNYDTVLWEEDQ